ncbi:hypothetical protein DY000_02002232 [Brassica cretica]|uniref:Uncharacterized protein n=1 Tax=Brassica cretica TaxID=69181 RepID=A0ABQ7BX22_BRACR|nr:hypothetical protein DY000_02002232 [Brassica cretica]
MRILHGRDEVAKKEGKTAKEPKLFLVILMLGLEMIITHNSVDNEFQCFCSATDHKYFYNIMFHRFRGNCSSSPAVAAVLLWRPPGLTFSFSFSSESLLLVLIVVSPFVFYGCLRRGDDPDPVQIQSLLALGETLTGKEILFASLRIG